MVLVFIGSRGEGERKFPIFAQPKLSITPIMSLRYDIGVYWYVFCNQLDWLKKKGSFGVYHI